MSKKNKNQIMPKPLYTAEAIELPVQVPKEIEAEQSAIRLLKLELGDIVAIGVKMDHLSLSPETENGFLKWKREQLEEEYPGIKFLLFPIGKVELSVLRKQQADNV